MEPSFYMFKKCTNKSRFGVWNTIQGFGSFMPDQKISFPRVF